MGVTFHQDLVVGDQGADIHSGALVFRVGIERPFGHYVDEVTLYRLVPYAARVTRGTNAFNRNVLSA